MRIDAGGSIFQAEFALPATGTEEESSALSYTAGATTGGATTTAGARIGGGPVGPC
jgi:hypothetical protein